MGLIFLIVLGAVLGSVATIIARAGDNPGFFANVLAGMAGALASALFINPLIGLGNLLRGEYEVAAMLVPLVGASVLIASLCLLRRSEMR